MKRWQNWLVPVLTFLTVFVLALLPRQVSLVQDRQLAGGIHSEELSSDSNFPFRPPSLVERFDMVSRWYLGLEFGEVGFYEGYVTEVYQHEMDLDDQPELYGQVAEELEALLKAGILPEEIPMLWKEGTVSTFTRVYLRDTSSLAGASFLMVDFFDKFTSWSIQLLLDEESGHVMNMQIYMEGIRERLLSQSEIPEIGEAFLNRLGLKAKLERFDNVYSAYSLESGSTGFVVFLTGDMLLLTPQIEEPEAVEGAFDETDAAVSSTGWKNK